MEKQISSRSVKNTYRASITYSRALDFGHVESIGAMDIESLKGLVATIVSGRNGKGGEARIEILRNNAQYPKFAWEMVESYTIGNHGGARLGAGRKASLPGDKRVQMVITIAPETRDSLKDIAKAKGVTPGRLIDHLIASLDR